MYSVQQSQSRGSRRSSIIPVLSIFRSCHLSPCFTTTACPLAWTTTTVWEVADRFFINSYLDLHTFLLFRYALLVQNLPS
jgi:hypothetical protein